MCWRFHSIYIMSLICQSSIKNYQFCNFAPYNDAYFQFLYTEIVLYLYLDIFSQSKSGVKNYCLWIGNIENIKNVTHAQVIFLFSTLFNNHNWTHFFDFSLRNYLKKTISHNWNTMYSIGQLLSLAIWLSEVLALRKWNDWVSCYWGSRILFDFCWTFCYGITWKR